MPNPTRLAANNFLKYLNASPSPWHAVGNAATILKQNGYKELKEASTQPWNLQKGGKYFIHRYQSSLFAFSIGGKFNPNVDGKFAIVGSHTDSPCFRIKPKSKLATKNNFLQLAVETYGGGTWPTWLDRDLRIAGRVTFKNEHGKLETKLVHVNKPVCRIPTCAIHLERGQGTKIEINKEDHMIPILCTTEAECYKNAMSDNLNSQLGTVKDRHHPALLNYIEKECGIKASSIVEFEICLADYQPAEIGGLDEEFIYGPRLDNLLNAYTSIIGLTESDKTIENDNVCRIATLFDHEEIGSRSAQGALGALSHFLLKRIIYGIDRDASKCALERMLPRSLCVSADMAHAVHPNYASKHASNLTDLSLHGGVVIKFSANQKICNK